MLLNGLVLYSFYALLARHRWRPLVLILAAGALLSIISNLLLIPTHGFMGAVATSILTHAFLAALLFPVSVRTLPISFQQILTLRLLAFILLFAAVLFTLSPFLTTIPAILIGMVIAGVALGTITVGLKIHRVVG